MFNIGSKVKLNVELIVRIYDDGFSGLYHKEVEQMKANPEKVYEVKGHENNVSYPRNIIILNDGDADGTYFPDCELILVSIEGITDQANFLTHQRMGTNKKVG